MTTYVRVCNTDALRRAIETVGTQTDVARAVGLSVQRLNALLTGVRPVIRVDHAAALEDALHVERGTLFTVDEPHLVGPYASGSNSAGAA